MTNQIILKELYELSLERTEYTFGQLLYEVLRKKHTKRVGKLNEQYLLQVKNDVILIAIERTRNTNE